MEARGRERPPQDGTPTSWTARILAPLALVIAAGAVIVVVSTATPGSDDSKRDRGERSNTAGCTPDAEQAVEDGYYVIEPGEDLSVVADRTCIPIDRLTELNENLDPQLLQVGSCVDLVVDGCKALADQ
jgi:hypothetical protein